MNPIWNIIFSGVVAAAVTSIISVVYSNKREKTNQSIRIIEQVKNMSETFGTVLGDLDDYDSEKDSFPASPGFEENEISNEVYAFCMWLNVISYLYLHNDINKELIEVSGIDLQIEKVYTKIEKSNYNPGGITDQWKYLRKLSAQISGRRDRKCFL